MELKLGKEKLQAQLRGRQLVCILIALLPLLACAVLAVDMNISDLDLPWLLLALGLILDGGYCMAHSLCSRRLWSQIVGYVLSFATTALLAGAAVVVAIVFALRDFLFQGQLPSLDPHPVRPPTLWDQAWFHWSVVALWFLFTVLAGSATVLLIATHRKLREVEPPSPPFRFTPRALLPSTAWVLLFVLLCICMISMR